MTISRNRKLRGVDKAKAFRDFAKLISRSENPFISFGPVLRLGLGILPAEEDEDEVIVPMPREEHDEYMRIFEGCPGWTTIVAKLDRGDSKLLNVLVDEMDESFKNAL